MDVTRMLGSDDEPSRTVAGSDPGSVAFGSTLLVALLGLGLGLGFDFDFGVASLASAFTGAMTSVVAAVANSCAIFFALSPALGFVKNFIGSFFPPNMMLPRFENDRLPKSSQRLSSGIVVVMGTKLGSAGWDPPALSPLLTEDRADCTDRVDRGGDILGDLGDFGEGDFGEPRMAAGDTASGDAAPLLCSWPSCIVLLRSRFVPVDRRLNVFPSFLVNESVLDGDANGAESVSASASASVGDSVLDPGLAETVGTVGTMERLRVGGDASFGVYWSVESASAMSSKIF
jgi:hypothetical protein